MRYSVSNMQNHILVIALICLGIVERLLCIDSEGHELGKFPFTVSSQVDFYQKFQKETELRFRGEFHENYSFDQKRAKIWYQTENANLKTNQSSNFSNVGVVHIDPSFLGKALFRTIDSSYQLNDINYMDQVLHFDIFDFRLDPPIPSHVVGPAKLLFLIDRNKHKLQYYHLDEVQKRKLLIGYNMRYTYEDSIDGWNEFKLTIDYRLEQSDLSAPSNVMITWPGKPGNVVFVRFSMIEYLLPHGGRFLTTQRICGGDLVFDPFLITPMAGVSNILADKEETLFPGRITETTSFSFKAEIEYFKGQPKSFNNFVAFDGAANSFRVDTSDGMSRILNLRFDKIFYFHQEQDKSNADFISFSTGDEGEQVECIVTRINHLVPRERTVTSLVGGSDKFVFLGLAQIRGIDVRVYEYHKTSLPIWLESPLSFKGSKPKSSDEFSTLLFASGDGDKMTPIFMKIYKNQYQMGRQPIKRLYANINIREFKWNLQAEALNGDIILDLFSIADRCPSPSGNIGRVSMSLVSISKLNDDQTNSLTKSNSIVDFTLMRELQRVHDIPLMIIYDLNSRLVLHDENINIATTFKVTQTKQKSNSISALMSLNTVESKQTITSPTLETCFESASRLGHELKFAYNPTEGFCYLDVNIGPNQEDNNRGSISVYSTSLQDDHSYPDPLKNLYTKSEIGNLETALGSKFDVPVGQGSYVQFKVVDFKVNLDYQLGNSSRQKGVEIDQIHRISGLSLIESDSRNTRLDSATSFSSDLPPMTIDRCKSLCYSDASCQLYSICLKESGIQCIVSNAKVSMQQLSQELVTSGSDRRLRLKIDEGQPELEFEKHRNCDLHAKDYLQYFNPPKQASCGYYDYKDLYKTSSVDECAQKCLIHNYNLANDKQVDRALQSNRVTTQPDSNVKPCKQFNLIKTEVITKNVKLNSLLKDDANNEYCIFDYEQTGVSSTSSVWTYLWPTDMYKFDMLSLYSEQTGISLKPSPMSDEEKASYVKLRDREDDAHKHLTKMENFILQRKNAQSLEPDTDKSACASLCFSRLNSQWPSCRSFDIVYVLGDQTSAYYCKLNSITLEEAMKSSDKEIIEQPEYPLSRQTWHFEPTFDPKALEISMNQIEKRNDSTGDSRWGGLSFFVRGIFLTLAAMIGILAGYVISRRQLNSSEAERRRTSVEFILDTVQLETT